MLKRKMKQNNIYTIFNTPLIYVCFDNIKFGWHLFIMLDKTMLLLYILVFYLDFINFSDSVCLNKHHKLHPGDLLRAIVIIFFAYIIEYNIASFISFGSFWFLGYEPFHFTLFAFFCFHLSFHTCDTYILSFAHKLQRFFAMKIHHVNLYMLVW